MMFTPKHRFILHLADMASAAGAGPDIEHMTLLERAKRLGGVAGCELIVGELSRNTPRDPYVNVVQWCTGMINNTLYEDVIGKLALRVDVHADGAFDELHELLCVTEMFPDSPVPPRGIDICAAMAVWARIKPVSKASLATQVSNYCAKHPDTDEGSVADYIAELMETKITCTMDIWFDAIQTKLDNKHDDDEIEKCASLALQHAAYFAGVIDDTLPRFRAQRDAMRALGALTAKSTCEDAKKLYALMLEHKALDVFCVRVNERECCVIPVLPFPLV